MDQPARLMLGRRGECQPYVIGSGHRGTIKRLVHGNLFSRQIRDIIQGDDDGFGLVYCRSRRGVITTENCRGYCF